MDDPARSGRPASRRSHGGLEQRLRRRYEATGCPPGTTVVVGFSGGPDSVALLGALAHIQLGIRVDLLAVHVDHGLRGDSANEQDRAAQIAAALGVPFRAERVSKDVRLVHFGVGLEEAARRERYRLLAQAARDVNAGLVALAHHETDQAETVLLHLLRGAGLDGAAGMTERSTLCVPWWPNDRTEASWQLDLWRPFLVEPRATVRAYAGSIGVEPIEDPSNDDRSLRRNAVRHEVLPLLDRVVPGGVAALARFGHLAADDARALDDIARHVCRRIVTSDGALARAGVVSEPAAVRRRVVRRWIEERGGYDGLSADRTDAVVALCDGRDSGRRIEVGDGWTVVTVGDVLRLARDHMHATAEGRGETTPR